MKLVVVVLTALASLALLGCPEDKKNDPKPTAAATATPASTAKPAASPASTGGW